MTDRELLEAAAKAAGYKVTGYDEHTSYIIVNGERFPNGHQTWYWNPLTDDGDALRLAVKLWIQLTFFEHVIYASVGGEATHWTEQWIEGDPQEAARRAIVRCAAAIGESK